MVQKSAMLYVYQLWAFLVIVFSFFGLLFIPILPIALLPFKLRLRCVQPLWRLFSNILLRVAVGAQFFSQDRRHSKDKGFPPYGLYIANHQSFLDIPLLITQFQIPPIMKKEVLYIPLFGFIGWVCGSLVVSRGKHNSRKKVLEQTKRRLIKHKIAIQYYPEGTRSKDDKIKSEKDIKTALIQIAYENYLPVFPCSIFGTRNAFEKQNLIKPFCKMGVIVHEAQVRQNDESLDDFIKRCWEKVQSGYTELEAQINSSR